ncbi:MAG: hypothetical protein EOM30_12555 [Clostridia bacterium]|nr:hypothetical protein [Clostridia bacterium]NLS84239.1 DUF4097 domain-containing protein [Oscillospiraceae bacterium]
MNHIGRIGYILLAVGLALGLAGFAMGGRPQVDVEWNSLAPHLVAKKIVTEQYAVSREEKTTQNTSDIKNLDIELGGAEVTIKTGDAFGVQATDSDRYKEYFDGDTYHVIYDKGVRFWEDMSANAQYTITVPNYEYDDVQLTIGAGKMTVDGISCKTAVLEAGAGTLDVTNFKCTEDSTLTVGMGTLDYTGTLLGANSIECGMGKVNLTLATPADYGYTVDCGLGSVSIGNNNYSGIAAEVAINTQSDNVYNVDCGMGTVKIKFN